MATPMAQEHRKIRRGSATSTASTNVDDTERWVSGISGAALVLYGLRRRSIGGTVLAALGAGLLYRSVTGRSVLYQALNLRLIRTTGGQQRIEVAKTLTINRPPEELYRFWRHFENLPSVMRHLESVTVQDDKRSHWIAKGPAGSHIKWDAEIVNEKTNQLIAWQSCEGADIDHWGVVRFVPAPGGRGTEVTVELEYEPIAGSFGASIAKLFGEEPAQQIEEDLRRFKQLMEAGEAPTTAGQPRGK
ncbi:MAG TPA: SRPBCC family protein [Nitrospiraceae bacterium]|nr:SRPBCC family protein [Nitrospiraceae bacterium]